MKLEEIEIGQSVKYIPLHAKGNINHSDCEVGYVTSKNEKCAFVCYDKTGRGQATDPEDLV